MERGHFEIGNYFWSQRQGKGKQNLHVRDKFVCKVKLPVNICILYKDVSPLNMNVKQCEQSLRIVWSLFAGQTALCRSVIPKCLYSDLPAERKTYERKIDFSKYYIVHIPMVYILNTFYKVDKQYFFILSLFKENLTIYKHCYWTNQRIKLG